MGKILAASRFGILCLNGQSFLHKKSHLADACRRFAFRRNLRRMKQDEWNPRSAGAP